MSSVLSHLAQSGRPLVHSASCGAPPLHADHLTPWTGALLSCPSALSGAGHTLSLISSTPGPSCWVGGEAPGAAAWRGSAEGRTGSWWEAWSAWVVERSGGTTDAPAGLGSECHPPLEPAPAAYVLDREPVSRRASTGPSGRRL